MCRCDWRGRCSARPIPARGVSGRACELGICKVKGQGSYLLGYVADGGEDAQDVEEFVVVVGLLDWAHRIAFWQFGEDRGGDEVGAEEWGGGGGG